MANIKYKYTRDILESAVKRSKSYVGAMRLLGMKISGGNHSHLKRQVEKFGISVSHFESPEKHLRDAAAKLAVASRLSPEEVFNSSREYRIKGKVLTRALLASGREYQCAECGVKEQYNNKPIVLEVDHMDGNWKNNKKENLRFLCPNCHSQQKV